MGCICVCVRVGVGVCRCVCVIYLRVVVWLGCICVCVRVGVGVCMCVCDIPESGGVVGLESQRLFVEHFGLREITYGLDVLSVIPY